MNKSSNVNVVLVQFNPKYKQISANITYLNNQLSKYKKEDKIDLIIFPEMALTGYIFDNKEDIEPYLSEFDKGETFDFCSNLAKRLSCYVLLGYPEKAKDNKYYNSCMIVDREGKSHPSYHKHFLYKDDKTWSLEGEQNFGYFEIKSHENKLVKIGLGICMDINPYEFEAPWEKMEFATHCYQKDVDLIAFVTGWTDYEEYADNSQKAILKNLNYWVARMEPFTKKKKNHNVYFLAADRTGLEKGTHFLGCSCIIQLCPKVNLLASLDKRKEDTIFYSLKL